LVGLFLLFGFANRAEGTHVAPIQQPEPRLASLKDPQNPNTETGLRTYKPKTEALRAPVSDFTCSTGSSQGCVLFLRSKGFCVPRTPTGGAGSLPVRSTDLPPIGEEVYFVSYETPLGHVGRGIFNGKDLVSTIDSAGSGRIIPLALYKGWY